MAISERAQRNHDVLFLGVAQPALGSEDAKKTALRAV